MPITVRLLAKKLIRPSTSPGLPRIAISAGSGSRGITRSPIWISPDDARIVASADLRIRLVDLDPAEEVDVVADQAAGIGIEDLLLDPEDRELVALLRVALGHADVDTVVLAQHHAVGNAR